MGTGALEVLVDGLDHPEGVAYDPESGVLWAGGEEGQLYRVDLDSRSFAEVARARGLVLGLAVDGRSGVALCCPGDCSVSVWDGRQLRRVADGFTFPNYPAFAPDGTLFVSDSGEWERNDKRLWRIDVDGTADVFSTDVPHFTNGCAVSLDAGHLWVVESYERRTCPASTSRPASTSTCCASKGRCPTASRSRATAACS